MQRTEARALAKELLDDTGSYATVYDHEPKRLDGSPCATVHGRSMGIGYVSHGEVSVRSGLWITVWVAIDDDGSAVEDQLDALVLEAMEQLSSAFAVERDDGSIPDSESGYRLLDGVAYRVERFVVRSNEDD